MSKILVVEPYRILQRAIALSFFPEHQVEVTEEIPDMNMIEQHSYDVAIIDAGALREKNTAGDLKRRLHDWQIPIIWLEENISTVAPVGDKLVCLGKPIARNDLLAALSRCQAKGSTIPLITGEKLRNETVLAASELKPDPEHRAQIIELVDVVEEETTDHRRDEPPQRKKQ